MLKFCIFLLISISTILNGSEIDSFSIRDEILQSENNSAIFEINRATNDKLEEAVYLANMSSNQCDPDQLILSILNTLSGKRLNISIDSNMTIPISYGFLGFIESLVTKGHDINNQYSLPIFRVKKKNSIYKNFNVIDSPGLIISNMAIGTIIKVNNLVIGSDKFGHFLSQGYGYYLKKNEDEAIKRGEKLEKGILGLATSGVYSYADLVANFEGYQFYKEISLKKSPYIKCINNRWVKNKFHSFDWRRFINPAWDEGVNCSTYKNKFLEQKIQNEFKKLSIMKGYEVNCPVSYKLCNIIYNFYFRKYGIAVTQSIISPKCINI